MKQIRIDFHIHTHDSPDSKNSPRDIIKRSRELGIDIVGITNHNTTHGAPETKKLSQGNPQILIGQEINTGEGEILVFNSEGFAGMDFSLCTRYKTKKSKILNEANFS